MVIEAMVKGEAETEHVEGSGRMKYGMVCALN